MKKSDRCTYDYHSNETLFFGKWNNKSVVNIWSNFLTDKPVQFVEGRVKRKSDVNLAQPFQMNEYNSGMGDASVIDWLL